MSAHRTQFNKYGSSIAVINIYGGMFTNKVSKLSTSTHMGAGCDFDINIYGGDYAWSSPYVFDANNAAQIGRINLHGGVFTAQSIIKKYSEATIGFYWNGGTFRPISNDTSMVVTEPWSYNIVSTNGAIFDIGKDKVFRFNQEFTHDEALSSNQDGGIEKRGEGTLLMDSANSFNGPCIVSGGVMRPSLTSAVPSGSGIVANGSGCFDMNGLNFVVPYLKGDGGIVNNGVLTVTDLIDPMSTVTLDNLRLGENVVFKSRHSCDEDEQEWKYNFFKVLSSATGSFTIVLGHEPAYEIPDSFSIKVAEFAPGVTEPKTKVINAGRPSPRFVLLRERRLNAEGNTELWVTLGNSGLQIMFK
jgi:autotransporter-associated beta strand protein